MRFGLRGRDRRDVQVRVGVVKPREQARETRFLSLAAGGMPVRMVLTRQAPERPAQILDGGVHADGGPKLGQDIKCVLLA